MPDNQISIEKIRKKVEPKYSLQDVLSKDDKPRKVKKLEKEESLPMTTIPSPQSPNTLPTTTQKKGGISLPPEKLEYYREKREEAERYIELAFDTTDAKKRKEYMLKATMLYNSGVAGVGSFVNIETSGGRGSHYVLEATSKLENTVNELLTIESNERIINYVIEQFDNILKYFTSQDMSLLDGMANAIKEIDCSAKDASEVNKRMNQLVQGKAEFYDDMRKEFVSNITLFLGD